MPTYVIELPRPIYVPWSSNPAALVHTTVDPIIFGDTLAVIAQHAPDVLPELKLSMDPEPS